MTEPLIVAKADFIATPLKYIRMSAGETQVKVVREDGTTYAVLGVGPISKELAEAAERGEAEFEAEFGNDRGLLAGISDRELDGWIAEFVCGWRDVVCDQSYQLMYQARGTEPTTGTTNHVIPSYSSNELAVVRAEKALAKISRERARDHWECLLTTAYASALCDVTGSAWAPSMGFKMLVATPRQKCEAMYMIREAITKPACEHAWVSADRDGSDGGPVIEGMEVCIKCKAFRSADWVGEREQK